MKADKADKTGKDKMKEAILPEIDISDNDIYEAMKDIHGYLDVTPADLKEIYRFAYRHALDRLTGLIKASDVMTTEVLSVKRRTPLRETARMMADNRISGVPVLEEDGKVAGIISMKDFFLRIFPGGRPESGAAAAACLICRGDSFEQTLTAEDIMSSPAITVGMETPASEISNILIEKGINRVPVTNDRGGLMGIVTRSDIVRAMSVHGRAAIKREGE